MEFRFGVLIRPFKGTVSLAENEVLCPVAGTMCRSFKQTAL